MKPSFRWITWLAVLLLGACAGTVPPPDWKMEALGALERGVEAYLSGNTRVETQEFGNARSEVSKTGRADLVARVELVRCAARVASLVFEDCAGFSALAQDATPAERAYAQYLDGQVGPQDVALLPPPHQVFAGAGAQASDLNAVVEPLTRLVAAGVLMRSGRADPAVIRQAIDTASAQGWRRPLLAWLGVQALRAEQAGDTVEAARIRRRMALASGGRVGTP